MAKHPHLPGLPVLAAVMLTLAPVEANAVSILLAQPENRIAEGSFNEGIPLAQEGFDLVIGAPAHASAVFWDAIR
jgi:hypothetical protein